MNIMKEAHKLTKEIIKEFGDVDYKAQLGICISYLSNNKGEIEMVELKGSEKQIKWGKDIQVMISKMEEQFNLAVNSILEKGDTEEDLSMSGYDVNELKESFKAIHECEEAKTLINAFSKLKMYMIEENQQKLDSATKLGHYYEVYKKISMVISQF